MFYTIGRIFIYFCFPFLLSAQAPKDAVFQEESSLSYTTLESEYLDQLAVSNPFLVERWSYIARHGWEIKTFPSQKGEPPYQQLEEGFWHGHNVLDLELKGILLRQPNQRSYYRIGASNTILILHSSAEITHHMNLNRNFTHPQKSSK